MKMFDQNFHTTRIIDRIKDWQDYRHECVATYTSGAKRVRTASELGNVDWSTFNLNDYIFTHNTIVASVASAQDGHTITEGSVDTINANQNAWLNDVLGPPTNIYRSFRGAENFYEHVQDFRLSKGKVLDTVLRKVKNQAGEPVWYCDILVATNRRHRDLATRIAKGELDTLSMGCLANITQCSKCGKVMRNDWEACNHIRYEIGQPYITPYGYESKVAELCGMNGHPESCRFIEASWVEAPAFKGAVVNHYISIPEVRNLAAKKIINIEQASAALRNINLCDIDTLKRVRVADKHSMVALKLFVSGLSEAQRKHRIESIGHTLENL
jgi:hypothetical protein